MEASDLGITGAVTGGVERLLADLDRLGGVARRSTLRERGHTDRTIRAAISTGRARPAGRRWLTTTDADTDLAAAARLGVLITCSTAAARLGLWTVAQPQAHVAPRRPGERPPVAATTIVHWARPVVARHPDSLVDPIENVLSLVASCLPREQALTVWESALRKRLVDPLALARLRLGTRARDVLMEASGISDSGLETIFRVRLRWLKVRVVPQAWVHGHRVDFLIGERLVVQIDGGTHVDAQRASDIRHDAELMLRGYHVIRVGYAQVMHDWPGVQHLIVQAISQGLHRAR